jgi:PTS system mannose-specific IIC component
MIPEALTLLGLALLGGWVAADGTSAGQFMVSRPLVAGTLAGWLAGDPASGAAVGVLLEAFHLAVLPVGAARYPEGGPPAVVAGAAVALHGPTAATVLTAVTFALGWQWVAGVSVRYLRQFNVRLVARAGAGDLGQLQRRHLLAVASDFARGVLLVLLGGVVLAAMLAVQQQWWVGGERFPRLVLGAALAGLLASSARLLGTRTGWFVAGAAGGLLLLLLRL